MWLTPPKRLTRPKKTEKSDVDFRFFEGTLAVWMV
jgi:hypothetical protein